MSEFDWDKLQEALDRLPASELPDALHFWNDIDPVRPHRDFHGNPISFREWCVLAEGLQRIVAQNHVGDYFVSTVWIGLDHGYGGDCPPLIFETMVFKDGESVECDRYSTWAEAEEGHARLLNEVRLLEAAT